MVLDAVFRILSLLGRLTFSGARVRGRSLCVAGAKCLCKARRVALFGGVPFVMGRHPTLCPARGSCRCGRLCRSLRICPFTRDVSQRCGYSLLRRRPWREVLPRVGCSRCGRCLAAGPRWMLCAGTRIGIRLRAVPCGRLPRVGCSPWGRCLAARSLCGRGVSVSTSQAISYFRKRKLKNLKYSHIFRERKHIYFGI